MPKEIERKFIVHDVPDDLPRFPQRVIEQGYLVTLGEEMAIRLRRADDAYYQTVKTGGGLSRTEVEISLSRDQFDALWPLTQGRRVSKVRYEIPMDQWTIELDVFEENLTGLVLAEVEFGDVEEATAFDPPTWFGKEVTKDFRYRNQVLAVEGMP